MQFFPCFACILSLTKHIIATVTVCMQENWHSSPNWLPTAGIDEFRDWHWSAEGGNVT